MLGWIIPIFVDPHHRLPWFIANLFIAVASGPLIANLIPRKHGLPMHLEHFIERIGLFVIIVMGESVNGMTLEPDQKEFHLYAAGVFGFICVLSVKFLYFDVDVKTLDDHALRYRGRNGMVWMYTHAVLTCALAVVGSGLLLICEYENSGGETTNGDGVSSGEGSEMVKADDEPTGQSIHTGRWYLVGGSAVCFACFTLFRLLHAPLKDEDPTRKAGLELIFKCQLGGQIVFALLLLLLVGFTDMSNLGMLWCFCRPFPSPHHHVCLSSC